MSQSGTKRRDVVGLLAAVPSSTTAWRVLAILLIGFGAGALALVGLEPRYFAGPDLPEHVSILTVDTGQSSAERAPADRYVGLLPDGSQVFFSCPYPTKSGDGRIITTSRGLLTGRIWVKGPCWFQWEGE